MKTTELPKGWKSSPLGGCCSIISGSTPRRNVPEYWDGDILWVTPKDISGLGLPVISETPEKISKLGYDSCSATILPRGSVLFSSRAPIGLVAIVGKEMCTNQGFKSLIPGNELDSGYLYHCMKRMAPKLANLGTGATFKEVSKEVVSRFEIPVPPLTEQKRIAAILDKADAIRRKRRQALAMADQFLRAVFLEMFGDPVTNPKGWKSEPLSNVVQFVSGGTPSKENPDYWDGSFPWVSPKDMKCSEICDAADHVNDRVFNETPLRKIPENSLLIVVRGMILVHTVPTAITTQPVAINQDI